EVRSRPGATAEAERRAAASSGQTSENAKPSEFPTDMRPQMGGGPRETARLAGLDAAIREAARGTVGGEGGAPPANPEGGFVDSGPISFDTTWYDWGPYAAEMVRRIKLHWDVPELARLGWKGKLTVRFFILADGTVADAKIIRGSSIPPFDHAAFQAIITSSPFRPLPADLHSQREGVTVTFFYNLRPEEDAAQANQAKP
ncbi:MAG: energy transducer TonB, partial [Thermoanaerobaculia bacterium]